MGVCREVLSLSHQADSNLFALLVKVHCGLQAVATIVAGACYYPDALGMRRNGHGQLSGGPTRFFHQGLCAACLKKSF
jgi:hypothetical protein